MLLNRQPCVCEICGEPRSKRIHSKCSRILQKRHNPEEWAKINKAIKEDDFHSSLKRQLRVRINGRTYKDER